MDRTWTDARRLGFDRTRVTRYSSEASYTHFFLFFIDLLVSSRASLLQKYGT